MVKVAATGVPAGGLRLLVLDDDHDCTDRLAKLLTDWGHEVCCAYDGQEAIERARIWRPHMALLALQMPELDGFQVAECLRRQPASKDAVLVAMAGRGEPESWRRLTAGGFAHQLLKPVNRDDLRDLIAAVRASLFTTGRSSEKRTGKIPLPRRKDLR